MNCLVANMGMVPTIRSNVHSYAGNDGEQHINFVGSDGQVRELFYRPGGRMGEQLAYPAGRQ